MRSHLIITFVIAVLSVSCSSQESTYTVEIIDNERHVHNISPKWENDSKIELEFVRQTGDLETVDPNLILHNPRDVALDKNGNFYICDTGNHRIQKFDKTGKYVCTIGRRGKGPNELEYPYYIYVSDQDELFITLSDWKITKVFDLNGNYLRTLRDLKEYTILLDNGQFARLIAFDIQNNEAQVMDYLKNYKDYPLFNVYDENNNKTGQFGKGMEPSAKNPSWKLDHFLTADNNNNYYIGWEAFNRLEKYGSDGKLIYRADRKRNYAESDKLERKPTTNRLGEPAESWIFNRFTKNICVDGKLRLWVEAYTEQATVEERKSDTEKAEPVKISFEVYDQEGILLQRIPWDYGRERNLKHIDRDRMFFVSRENECVYEYRIIDKEE
ncbi:6-bladed beta-propeller [candidate division KSB1 bacterium]